MKHLKLTTFFWLFFSLVLTAQNNFSYSVHLDSVAISNLPGVHSFAYAQHDGKWLVIGGRLDGIHARQPFNAFPENQNNQNILVIDPVNQQYWSSSVSVLQTNLKEQLQSTNMNFYQDNDTLYIIGGYAFSPTANDHITFPYLASVQVSDLMNAVINNASITPYFKQITDTAFAVTGGQMGKIGNEIYLIGGHRFDGRYNPMNNPTFVQKYTNQIRKFVFNNSGTQLSFSNYSTITDPIHLRRRDYNLLPQIFPDGSHGYTISSGVFQINVDLPFLYPVDITAAGHTPITSFNQYLSNYHGAKVALHDSINNEMHNLFFGGISQYYYQNNTLVQDNQVPFVKTISRMSRDSSGNLLEVQLPIEMSGYRGAGSEFFINKDLPRHESKVIKLDAIQADTILLGYIFGGILSPTINPFANNVTNTTSADNKIYKVYLIKDTPQSVYEINGKNPYQVNLYPNPVDDVLNVSFEMENPSPVDYFVTDAKGAIVQEGKIKVVNAGETHHKIKLNKISGAQTLFVTFIFDDKFYVSKKVVKN
ncbi:MAG: hypothetical protein RQ875_00480 [Vicingaceae bacterium]|nr:hypothetical protein [Vicingaceae bacterium]